MGNHRNRESGPATYLAVALLSSVFALSCEGNGGSSSYAKAFDNGPDTTARERNADGMKALRERAEQDAMREREAQIETLTAVITPLPADVKTACEQAGGAFDHYARARLDAEALERWDATKEPDIQRFVEQCEATQQVAVGACMTHALTDAAPTMFGPEDSTLLAKRCRKRWAGADVTASAPRQ
jgi:hypothetical protein